MPAGSDPGQRLATMELATLLRFADLALEGLAEAREEIDALNVYPVPDGDTGTNLFLTFEAARNAMVQAVGGDPEGDLRTAFAALARGALLGARGNSGVILSQLVGALVRRLAAAGPQDRSAVVFADAMRVASEAAYAAVGEPVEGTILTVARCAAEAAVSAAGDDHARLGHVVRAAASEARATLLRTPELLATLAEAGVVDAGGRGLCVVLDAAESAVTGKRPVGGPAGLGTRTIPVPLPVDDLTEDGPSYEVMYLLDAEDVAIPALRERLAPLGDSLVVVGGEGLWNVHVHVDDVGAAVEAGIESGRPRRIRVTHFAEQAGRRAEQVSERRPEATRMVVAVAAGPGLATLFEEAGGRVLRGGPGSRPSTGEILAAIEDCGAEEVIVLPNDQASVGAAEAAARTAEESGEIRVQVIPTRAQVQGLAAIAVHEPGRGFDADVLQMTASARHARQGAVTVAARRAMTMAGPCEPGDVLGAIEGDFVVVGRDLDEVAVTVLERLLGGGGELVTIVAGDEGAELAERASAYVASNHPTVDVVVYDGGQGRYPLLVAVE